MQSALNYLISAQHELGGWGYHKGDKPVVEPTAVALLAIRDEPGAEKSFQRGISWLLGSQNKDGGWGINGDDLESGWHTAWALIALKYSNQIGASITKAIEWLSYVGTYEITREEFQTSEVQGRDYPVALTWPWLPDQGCWIEPTALAVLALEGLSHSELASKRIGAALDYFLENRTPNGGWGNGNASPLDTIVLTRTYPTVLVLMALARIAPKEIQTRDLDALRQDLQRDPSILSQSSGLLALRILGENDEVLYTSLKESQNLDGSWKDNPFFTSWAMLALRGFM